MVVAEEEEEEEVVVVRKESTGNTRNTEDEAESETGNKGAAWGDWSTCTACGIRWAGKYSRGGIHTGRWVFYWTRHEAGCFFFHNVGCLCSLTASRKSRL